MALLSHRHQAAQPLADDLPRAGLPRRLLDVLRKAAIATVAVLIALPVALVLAPMAGSAPALAFLVAVSVAGWYGGSWPAAISTVVCSLLLDFFFEEPVDSLTISELGTVLDIGAFVVVALVLSGLHVRLQHARAHAEAARQEAVLALQARDEALAAVTHDLRTPITAIKASISTLRDQALDLAPSTRAHLLDNAEAEADRLAHFVTDALALTRLEAGAEPLLEWDDLGEVVSAVLDRCEPLLGDRPLTFSAPPDLPLMHFDAGLLGQALTNVVENAALHTPPGTHVAVTVAVNGPLLTLTVDDNGPGLPPNARERVFSKFERLNRNVPGAGLGLALARTALTQQGGQLWAEASPLGGARFVLALPAPTGETQL